MRFWVRVGTAKMVSNCVGGAGCHEGQQEFDHKVFGSLIIDPLFLSKAKLLLGNGANQFSLEGFLSSMHKSTERFLIVVELVGIEPTTS